MKTPIIGVTMDSEDGGGYSRYPWYALRQNYTEAVLKAGGLPVPLPHHPAKVRSYFGLLDGLLITGGDFDVDPSLFGATTTHETVQTKPVRTAFEAGIIRLAVDLRKPVLGICGGAQLLNVVLGGTLIQHIPDEVESPIAHEQPNPRHEPGHDLLVVENTRLHRILGSRLLQVNSAHHQAIKAPAPGAVVNAMATDTVIEGIELPDHPFCIGVQWHPEFVISRGDQRLFEALVEVAAGGTPP